MRDVGVLVGDEVLLGSTVRFDASRAKVVKIGPDPADPLNLARCETTYHSVFDIRVGTPFQWQVVERPPASAASLQGANGLTPTLVVDRPGEYHVRFTGCPTQPCKLAEPDVGIPRIEHTLMVTAVTEVAIPPDTEPPTLPGEPSPFATISDQEAARFCYGPPLPFPSPNTPPGPSNTWQSPQLVTVMRWAGPQHYELLEWRVRAAHVSRSDNDMNHDDNDFGFNVVLDPPYRRLERPGQDHPDFPEVHVEWEGSRIPDRYRPTRGDRTSVWGFWVLDCHHDDPIRTEIHPPVMVVSHRPRAVLLPEKFGSNVYVPGIVSDLWVNRDGRTNDRRLPRFSSCKPKGKSGCGQYTLNYDILDGTAFRPTLSPLAAAIYEAYLISPNAAPPQGPVRHRREWHHPVELVLPRGAPAVPLSTTTFFPADLTEPRSFDGVTTADFRAGLVRLRRERPERVERFMKELRAQVLRLSQSTLAAAGPEYLDMLRDAVSGELWSQYFADIQWPPGRQEAEKWRRVAAWLAVVALAAIGTLVFLSRWWAPSGP